MRFECSFASIARSNRLVSKITLQFRSSARPWLFPKARPYHCGGCYRHHNGGDPARDA